MRLKESKPSSIVQKISAHFCFPSSLTFLSHQMVMQQLSQWGASYLSDISRCPRFFCSDNQLVVLSILCLQRNNTLFAEKRAVVFRETTRCFFMAIPSVEKVCFYSHSLLRSCADNLGEIKINTYFMQGNAKELVFLEKGLLYIAVLPVK